MTDQHPQWKPPLGDPADIPLGPPTGPPRTPAAPGDLPSGQSESFPAPTSPGSASDGTLGEGMLGVTWGIVGFGIFLVTALVGIVLAFPFTDISFADLENSDLPVGALGMSILFQQLGQGGWPLVVGKWFPGVNWSDLRIGFKPVDLGIGLGTACISLFTASVFGFGASKLVGLEDRSAADNSQFLTDAKDSPWVYLIVFCVVIGAPVAEELFFRGLVLSSFEKLGAAASKGRSASAETVKKVGSAVGVICSTFIFTLPHFIGGTWQETVVLFASIGAVGAVLAVAAIYTNRLGAPMVAHMIFNSVGAAAALGVFGDLPT